MLADGVLYGQDQTVHRFVTERLGSGAIKDGPYVGLGFIERGDLAAGFVFFNYRAGSDVEIAIAIDSITACHPKNACRIVRYPFVQLDLPRVSAEIPLENERAVRTALAMGFVREGVKRKADKGRGHVGVFGLLRKDAKRFL